MNKDPQVLFCELLAALALQTNTQPNALMLDFYRNQLMEFGWERVNKALYKLLETQRRWPTVADIKDTMGVATDDALFGDPQLIADSIFGAIAKYGSFRSNRERVRNFIGSIGEEIVERSGGWDTLCEQVTYQNSKTFTAQWRESARALINEAVAGRWTPPERTALPTGEKMQLTAGEAAQVIADIGTQENRTNVREALMKLRAMRRELR